MAADHPIEAHYGRGGLVEEILRALGAAGMDAAQLSADDLSPVDQFHTRGEPATLDLARRAGIAPGMRVLDVGGGLGGPARTLASRFGCSVEVLDLTEELCRAAETLRRQPLPRRSACTSSWARTSARCSTTRR